MSRPSSQPRPLREGSMVCLLLCGRHPHSGSPGRPVVPSNSKSRYSIEVQPQLRPHSMLGKRRRGEILSLGLLFSWVSFETPHQPKDGVCWRLNAARRPWRVVVEKWSGRLYDCESRLCDVFNVFSKLCSKVRFV